MIKILLNYVISNFYNINREILEISLVVSITISSLFPRNSGITAKAGWYNKVDMTTLNSVKFLLLF